MRRREFIGLLGGAAAAWPIRPMAQQPSKVHRVGVLFGGSGRGSVPDEAFRSGLRARGYIDGQNINVEFRSAEGKYDQLPSLAAELIALKVDLIFAPAEVALRAALETTRTVPIIMAAIEYDPIEAGLVTSIGRPTGNVTGVFFRQQETSGKRIELLKEAIPALSRVAAFVEAGGKFQLDETERAASSLGISVRVLDLGTPPDFDGAFELAVSERIEAVLVLVSPLTYAQRAKIGGLATKHRLPSIAPFSETQMVAA